MAGLLVLVHVLVLGRGRGLAWVRVTRAGGRECRSARALARAGVDVGTGVCLAFKLDFHGAGFENR